MVILALDPATKCGWAIGENQRFGSGTWDLSVKRDESGGMRLFRLRAKLEELRHLSTGGIQFVAYEAARHGAPEMQGALVVQAEIQGVLKLWCQDCGIEFKGYSPSEIKKRATGKGNAPKSLVMKAAKARWPEFGITDDNEADALWLWDLAMSEYGVKV